MDIAVTESVRMVSRMINILVNITLLLAVCLMAEAVIAVGVTIYGLWKEYTE